MKEEVALKLIDQNRKAYNTISEHFDQTRSFLWNGLNDFAKYAKDNQNIMDFGCGNGRLIEIFKGKKINYFGLDISEGLLDITRKKYSENLPEGIRKAEYIVTEGLDMPFPGETFDAIYSIAAFHHIPSVYLRKKLLKEFHRVLKPHGKIILTNWNLWQASLKSSIYKYGIKKILGLSKMDFKDVLVSWKNQRGEIMAKRYYHAFTESELKNLVIGSGFKVLEQGYFGGKNDKYNLYIIAEK